MHKVVVLGGGTGLSTLLKGLKLFPLDITAVVSVADDGSSTGKLRKEFHIPAVGDLRNVLVSLSEVEPLVEELLQYRFITNSDLNNHAMGNLLLTALYNMTGSLTSSLEALSKILNIKGKVLPVTEDNPTLVAHTKQGETIIGESNITKAGKEIDYIEYLEKNIHTTKTVLKEIEEADYIILGIGSLYTSILPNLLTDDMKNALKSSKAEKIYISNAMTEHGETDNYTVSDCIKVINRYVDNHFIDVVLSSTTPIDKEIRMRYQDLEKSTPILIDEEEIKKMKVHLIKADLINIVNDQVRHDYIKTALAIFTHMIEREAQKRG